MKKILRSIGLTAAVIGSVGLGTTPANAAGGAVFSGTASINCFGCNGSTGNAILCAHVWVDSNKWLPVGGGVGVNQPCTYPGGVVAGGVVNATYSVWEPGGATCLVTGTASGTTTGAIAVTFNWTRVGAVAVISTLGQITGAGVAGFKVTSPVGLPCGGPVEAQVVGVVIGT